MSSARKFCQVPARTAAQIKYAQRRRPPYGSQKSLSVLTDVVIPSPLPECLSAPFVIIEGNARSLRPGSARGRLPFFSVGFLIHGTHHAKASDGVKRLPPTGGEERRVSNHASNPGSPAFFPAYSAIGPSAFAISFFASSVRPRRIRTSASFRWAAGLGWMRSS